MVFRCCNLRTSTGEFDLMSYSGLTQKVNFYWLIVLVKSSNIKMPFILSASYFLSVLPKVNVQEFGFAYKKSNNAKA